MAAMMAEEKRLQTRDRSEVPRLQARLRELEQVPFDLIKTFLQLFSAIKFFHLTRPFATKSNPVPLFPFQATSIYIF